MRVIYCAVVTVVMSAVLCCVQALRMSANMGAGGWTGVRARGSSAAVSMRSWTRGLAVMSSSSSSELQWSNQKVRSAFIDYFKDKHEHTYFKSSPVVPLSDPTLLFTNAGMNQFKTIFLGTTDPSSPLASLNRAVNSQKCIRAGGKHNDLDDVGKDTYHHTFFEMLGTWSFGNYFKTEAIEWAFDILTTTYGLDKERMYASYFGGDESLGLPEDTEAKELWLKFLPADRVLPFDKTDNFWEMGDTGPCGPCSEIHYDRIGGRDASSLVNADDPNVIEIWNLVFIQYNREPSGELRPLPSKHIDTGMGLERLTSILQEKDSNYDTDAFTPYFQKIEKVIGCEPYTGKLGDEDAKQGFKDMAYRVLADHARTITVAIADGATPSNEGRGYVLRRVLRRAVKFGLQNLNAEPGFFSKLVPVVAEELGSAFPELKDKTSAVEAIVAEEEAAFSNLLEKGVKYFEDVATEVKASGSTIVSGEKTFYMYDTLGFPVDLTEIMAVEKGLSVDLKGFEEAMADQKERGRQALKDKRLAGRVELALGAEQTSFLQKANVNPTDDSGKYEWDVTPSAEVKALFTVDGFVDSVDAGETVGVILDATTFYAESGGQAADKGTIVIGSGIELGVVDVQVYAGYVLHTCTLPESVSGLTVGAKATSKVDYPNRRKVAPNHTMTHVLNFALRNVMGPDVDQRGSSVDENRLRFDFSSTRGLKTDELVKVESIVNEIISSKQDVSSKVVPLKQAMEINGLRAVFGEVYPDPVRVISVGQPVDYLISDPTSNTWTKHSIEFCGGTHLQNTADALAFVLTEETAVAKGIRRISAITGEMAKEAIKNGEKLSESIQNLGNEVKKVKEGVDVSTFEDLIGKARTELEAETLSTSVKSNLRTQLEKVQKDIFNLKKAAMMSMVQEGIIKAKEQAADMVKSGQTKIILQMDIGSDSKGIKLAIEEIKKVVPGVAFIGVSADDDKISCFSFVPDALVADVKANDWVAKTLEVVGGRGGGKPNMAQGSAAISGVDGGKSQAIEKAMATAKSFV